MTLGKIGRYEFLAEPFHCDFSQRLFMGHLGNHLLNAADFHSNDRGFGVKHLQTVNRAWVLSRLAIEMDEMPQMYDRFQVETWVESAMRFFTNRNFRVVGMNPDGSERVYGYGRSMWAMIDTESRQPCNLLDIHDGDLLNWVEKDFVNPMGKLTRVKMDNEAELVRTIDTYYNDVDINGHINSVKYIEHVLDLWDINWYREHPIHRFDIAYVAESHQGDRLLLYCEQTGELEYCVRICRNQPATNTGQNETEEIEVVRSKVTFL